MDGSSILSGSLFHFVRGSKLSTSGNKDSLSRLYCNNKLFEGYVQPHQRWGSLEGPIQIDLPYQIALIQGGSISSWKTIIQKPLGIVYMFTFSLNNPILTDGFYAAYELILEFLDWTNHHHWN